MPSNAIVMIGLIVVIALTTGCTTAPIPPTYSKEELRARCVRTNGWWRPNLLDGYCEYRAPI